MHMLCVLSRHLCPLLVPMMLDVCFCCIDGFYKASAGCIKCPEHCKFCNSSNYCFICDTGFAGDVCQQFCSNCKEGTKCSKEDGFCKERCKDGFSGYYCNEPCDNNCNICYRYNNKKCGTCESVDSCDNLCPGNCMNQSCSGFDKHCTGGCVRGYWGTWCEYNCPGRCIDRRCNWQNGSCGEVTVADKAEDGVLAIHIAPPAAAVLCVISFGFLSYKLYKHRKRTRRLPTTQTAATNEGQEVEAEEQYLNYTPLQDIEEYRAISSALESQNVSRAQDPTYFAALREDDDMQTQYKPLSKPTYIALAETENTEHQYKPILEVQQEETEHLECRSSDTADSYITAVL